MKTRVLISTLTILLLICISPSKAVVVHFWSDFDYWTWEYFPRQLFTIIAPIGLDPFNPYSDFGHFGGVVDPEETWGDTADPESIFSVQIIATNNNDFPWTSFILRCNPTIIPGEAKIIPETVKSNKLQTITHPNRWEFEFSGGAAPVLPGEFLMIQFDMRPIAEFREFNNGLKLIPVPEPTTIVMLGLGSIVILRRRAAL